MYKNRSTTTTWVLHLSIKPTNGPEKIIHIPHTCRLYKLATFIFYVYKDNLDNSNFEFFYFDEESRSYGDYSSFKLKHGDNPLQPGVGNIRHARVDSVFFYGNTKIGLRIENKAEEYTITELETVPPVRGRMYPIVEKKSGIRKCPLDQANNL